jgi:hypothetical protein
MKYPKPTKKGNKFLCPVCGSEHNSTSGYRYHYRKYHIDAPKIADEKAENIKKITANVIKGLSTRERLNPIIRKGNLKPESWVLMFSDLHYGQLVKSNEVGGLSEYSPLIAKQRIEVLLSSVIHILKYHNNRPDELVIAFLGDIVDGSILRGNQQSNIEFGICKQMIETVELLTDFIVALSEYFPKIRCYGVYGNHARLTPNPKDSPPSDNFDLLVYHFVQQRIKDMKGISFDYTEAQHLIFRVREHNFWIEHGDSIRANLGFLAYGANRQKANVQEMLSIYGEKADYFLLGHFHRSNRDLNIYANGSFVGGDLYSIGRMRKMGLPVQSLIGVSEKYGAVWERPIKLSFATNIKPKIYS